MAKKIMAKKKLIRIKATYFNKDLQQITGKSGDGDKELVKNTVWHEIAHHFGMDEARVRQAEVRRRKISRRHFY